MTGTTHASPSQNEITTSSPPPVESTGPTLSDLSKERLDRLGVELILSGHRSRSSTSAGSITP